MKQNPSTNQSNNRPSATFIQNVVLAAWFSVVASLGFYLGTMHGFNLLLQLNQ